VEPGEVEPALWFYDAVHDAHAGDSEERSADWAAQAQRSAGVAGRRIERVRSRIQATTHDAVPSWPEQQLVVDIDLAILGARSLVPDKAQGLAPGLPAPSPDLWRGRGIFQQGEGDARQSQSVYCSA
jgi:predicted metal-dependent HD superfamily phosphohydrolase